MVRGGNDRSIGCLQFLILTRITKIPGFDDKTLGGIDIFFVLNLLHTYTEAVFREDDILAAHAFGRCLLNFGDAEVDLVADPATTGDMGQNDDERDNLASMNEWK